MENLTCSANFADTGRQGAFALIYHLALRSSTPSRLRCAFFCRPAGPTPCEPLRPPAARKGLAGAQSSEQKASVAAPQTRCKPDRGLNAGGRPWGGICENRGPGAENSQFSVPEEKFGTPESCPHFKALRTAHAPRSRIVEVRTRQKMLASVHMRSAT